MGQAELGDMCACSQVPSFSQCHNHRSDDSDTHACPQESRGFLITASQHSVDVLVDLNEKSSLKEGALG